MTYTKREAKQMIASRYGFAQSKIVLLEMDANYPLNYCTFKVCGLQYQIISGCLSIFGCSD